MEFYLNHKKSLWLFSAFALGFYLLDLASYFDHISTNKYFYEYYDEYLNITYETNLPTFFSFFIDILTGLTAWLLYRERQKAGWLVAAIFFTYMGLDDALQIHEYLGSYFGDAFLKGGFVSYYWQVFFDPFFAIVGGLIFLFLVWQFKEAGCKWCIGLLFAGYLCYAIAMGMDYYEGLNSDLSWLMDLLRMKHKMVIHVMRATEEYIEMAGAVMILSAILYLHPLKISVR
jgi:hypothetical protein